MHNQGEQAQLLELGRRIVSMAMGDEDIEVVASRGTETEVQAYGGAVESLTQASEAGISVRVIKSNRVGFAYTGSLELADIEATLRSARENSELTTEDPYCGLAEPDTLSYPELALFNEGVLTFPLENKVQLALGMERALRLQDSRIAEVPHASYGDAYGETAIVSTRGIEVASSESYSYAFVQALARDGGDTQSGFGYSVGRGPNEIDVEEAIRDAAERSTRLLGAKKPLTQRLKIVFEPRVTANLLAIIGSSLSAEAVQKGRSLFANRLSELISVPGLTLVDDPTDRTFQSASPFDGEGLASRRNPLIEDGKLLTYLYDSYTARKEGRSSMGTAVRGGYASTPSPGPRALALLPGIRSAKDLVGSVENGFLVQTISGLHSGVNSVSGDFSVGAEGMMIRHGELAEGVREATISSTIQRMLQGVVEIASDLTYFPGISAGLTLLIDEMSLSGT